MNRKIYISILLCVLFLSSIRAQVKPLNFLPDTIGICPGDSFLIKFPEDKVSKSAAYQWLTEYAIIVHAKQLYVKRKGKYIVKIADGKKLFADTTFVKISEKPKVHYRDTTLCNSSTLLLNTKNKSYKYVWNNVETSENIRVNNQGTYFIKINNKGCIVTDTFKVTLGSGVTPNFSKEYLVCESEPNKTLSVKAPNDVKLYWNTGSTLSSINPNKEGWYWVKSISKTCGTKTDSVYVKYKNCDCEIYIPNSFTPNDDDKNDVFAPVFQCEYSYFMITIFDRWGNTVYSSTNINHKWDGRFKNNPCPDDVYVYRIEAIQKGNDKKIIRNGHISLFR